MTEIDELLFLDDIYDWDGFVSQSQNTLFLDLSKKNDLDRRIKNVSLEISNGIIHIDWEIDNKIFSAKKTLEELWYTSSNHMTKEFLVENIGKVVPFEFAKKVLPEKILIRWLESPDETAHQKQIYQALTQTQDLGSRLFRQAYQSSLGAYEFEKFNHYAGSSYQQSKREETIRLFDSKIKKQFEAFLPKNPIVVESFGAWDAWFEIFLTMRFLDDHSFSSLNLHDQSAHNMKFLLHSIKAYWPNNFRSNSQSNLETVQTFQENFSWENFERSHPQALVSFINRFNNIFEAKDRQSFLENLAQRLGERTLMFPVHTANTAQDLEREKKLYEWDFAQNLYTFFAPYLLDHHGKLFSDQRQAQKSLLEKTFISTKIEDIWWIPAIEIQLKLHPWQQAEFLLNNKKVVIDESHPFPLCGQSLRFDDAELKNIEHFFKKNGYKTHTIKVPRGNVSYILAKKR